MKSGPMTTGAAYIVLKEQLLRLTLSAWPADGNYATYSLIYFSIQGSI